MDDTTVHDWKPTHPMPDPGYAELRRLRDDAWRKYLACVDEYYDAVITGEGRPDFTTELQAAQAADDAINAYLRKTYPPLIVLDLDTIEPTTF